MSSTSPSKPLNHELKFFHYVAIIFTLSFVVSNIFATKAASLFGISFSAGTTIFPLSYLCSDILTEVYGYKRARALVWFAMACGIGFAALCQLAIQLPPAEFWHDQLAFKTTLSSSWRIFIASNIAYIIGDFTNCRLIASLKLKYQGRFMALRFIGATVVGVALGNTLFMALAFGNIYPTPHLIMMIVAQCLIKICYEALLIPFTVQICRWLKEKERIDTFDTDTNFALFSLDSSYPISANQFGGSNPS